MHRLIGEWQYLHNNLPRYFVCGHCGCTTAGNMTYMTNHNPSDVAIYICSGCNRPTYFENSRQTPPPVLGNPVEHLPKEIEQLYTQARKCTQVEAYTACVMICRKILMHVAVTQGANVGLKFIDYVQYLSDKGYIPPGGKG